MVNFDSQAEYDAIISRKKKFKTNVIQIPKNGRKRKYIADVMDSKDFVAVHLTSSTYSAEKISHNALYTNRELLLRIDLGPSVSHTNPDGAIIHGPHIHYYVHGYGICWAEPLSEYCQKCGLDFSELCQPEKAFEHFCSRLNITKDWRLEMELDGNKSYKAN